MEVETRDVVRNREKGECLARGEDLEHLHDSDSIGSATAIGREFD